MYILKSLSDRLHFILKLCKGISTSFTIIKANKPNRKNFAPDKFVVKIVVVILLLTSNMVR